jgi:hypothetical protein
VKIKLFITKGLVLATLGVLIWPAWAGAANQLTARSATVDNSGGAAAGVGYTVKFTLGTNNENLGSVKFEICDSPVEIVACAGTAGSSGASFGSATFGSMSGLAGSWSANAGTAGGAGGTSILFKKASAGAETGQPAATALINNVTNPTAVNTEYYLRITSYSATNGTGENDYGAVAMDTTQAINVTGIMPESLVFCVGTTWNTGCNNITGSSVNLGTFSPVGTNVGASVMDASTNAGSGYVITVNGTTMMSGATPITAMGTQSANSAACAPSCTSAIGTSQFGTNVRANNVATAGGPFGADVNPATSGTFNGRGFSGYNTANSFRFFSGDTVAWSNNTVSDAQLFTNSYLVNVPGSQAAGTYTTSLTYICTATF